jgi:hypothetical protein
MNLNQNKVELKLDWCSHQAAKYAVEHWHYSKTVPTGKPCRIGVWENKVFIGVIFFGSGASAALGSPYKLNTFQVCELVRVALNKYKSAVTKIISIAIKLLKKQSPNIRLIVSFADPFHGHYGGIYQGRNWIYSGDSSISNMWKLPDGSIAHNRRFSGSGWNEPKPPPIGSIKIKVPGKHRYLMPLDSEMRKQIEPLRKSYPKKCATSIENDAAGFQPEKGGVIPTVALH